MTALFCDFSHHDVRRRGSLLDFDAIAAAGLGTVTVIRATYGDPATFHPTTENFQALQARAKTSGFTCRGGYHNLIHGDAASIARQVDWLRRELDTADAQWGMADIEPYEELKTNGLWPRWEDVLRWEDRWYQVEDRLSVNYIGEWVWRDWLGKPDLRVLRGPVINASYPGGDGTAQQIYAGSGGDTGRGWGRYLYRDSAGRLWDSHREADIWQFTSAANVPGASGSTDCNAFRGTTAELVALLTGGHDMPLTDQDIARIRTAVLGDGGVQALLYRVEAAIAMRDPIPGAGGQSNQFARSIAALGAKLDALLTSATGVSTVVAELRALLAELLDAGHPANADGETIQRLTDIAARLDALPGAVGVELSQRLAQ